MKFITEWPRAQDDMAQIVHERFDRNHIRVWKPYIVSLEFLYELGDEAPLECLTVVYHDPPNRRDPFQAAPDDSFDPRRKYLKKFPAGTRVREVEAFITAWKAKNS